MKEFRCFGPPGTGKTSRLATRDVPRAVEKYGPDKVMITSFTKAAAREIATKKSRKTGRAIDVDPENVGTLHAICFRALKEPKIIEKDKELIAEWNSRHKTLIIKEPGKSTLDDVYAGEAELVHNGDVMLNRLNIARNKMIKPTGDVAHFEKIWTQFKQETGSVDFTDLIETAIRKMPYAPGNPEVFFVDEAQDFTKLQLTLVRSWAQQMQWLVLVGDDDQSLYHFAGALPDAFLNPPIDQKFKTILKQSYRVPAAVLVKANELIEKVSQREPKTYRPRVDNMTGNIVKGIVTPGQFTWRKPDSSIKLIQGYMADGKTVMILASCSYMLTPTKNILRQYKIPFHNPYRQTRGDWNPLGTRRGATSSAQLLSNFIETGLDDSYWNIPQLVSWAKFIKVGEYGLIKKQGKVGIKALEQAIENSADGLHTSRDVLAQILSPAAIQPALNRNVDWLLDNLLATRRKSIEFVVGVYKNYGIDAINNSPQVVIGTIHSVKGGEADVVILFPDISYEANQEFHKSVHGRDSVFRMFYVGMTRARETLIVANPSHRGAFMKAENYIDLKI